MSSVSIPDNATNALTVLPLLTKQHGVLAAGKNGYQRHGANPRVSALRVTTVVCVCVLCSVTAVQTVMQLEKTHNCAYVLPKGYRIHHNDTIYQ